jgi:hypothetical protein
MPQARRRPGLCVDIDAGPFTLTAAANRCRVQGTHLCSSAELRNVMSAGLTLGTTLLDDWMDNQDADDSALFVNNTGNPTNPGGAASANGANGWSRCCASVE